jgi:phage gp36-like protein
MSTFIDKADYASVINNNVLDAITEVDDNKLDVAELRAISEMQSYLANRYDTDAIFSATGIARHNAVLMFCLDMTLYHLHALINPRKIPEYRKERYTAALDWLQGISMLKINPDLPKPINGDKAYVLFGSNIKRTNHI